MACNGEYYGLVLRGYLGRLIVQNEDESTQRNANKSVIRLLTKVSEDLSCQIFNLIKVSRSSVNRKETQSNRSI